MRKIFLVIGLTMICFAAKAQEPDYEVDAEGTRDHPLFNRMPNTYISEQYHNYDLVEIQMSADVKESKEGTKTRIAYNQKVASARPSFYQIVKNYENAITSKGGKRIYYGGGVATLFVKNGAQDIWILLEDASGINEGNYWLTVLEIEPMKQEVTANDLLKELNANGSVALYINFETAKADIKAESQKIIDEMAAMLTSNPALKISIEGHTDNVGSAASNKTLSEKRAQAVMSALVAKGIAKDRLSSKGWGQEKPVADNTSEDGKAKNRRVEIVKK
jgi:OmpA-OmpF porin, OOP family